MSEDYAAARPTPSVHGSPIEPRPTWGWKSLAIVTFIAALVPLAILFSPDTSEEELTRDELIASGVIGIFWYLGIASVVYYAARATGGSLDHLGVREPVPATDGIYAGFQRNVRRFLQFRPPLYLVVPLLGYVLSYLCVVVYSLISTLIGSNELEPDEQVPSQVFDDRVLVVLMGMSILIAAPLVEELFFRGFLFGGLRKWLSFWPAAAVSGFVFSLAHQDLGLIIPFTLVGMVLAYSYEKMGTLWGSISVHFVFNLVSFAVLLLVPDFR